MYRAYVRLYEYESYIGTDYCDVHIDENTKEDDIMEALMNEVREVLNSEHEGNESWENGDMRWEIVDYVKL